MKNMTVTDDFLVLCDRLTNAAAAVTVAVPHRMTAAADQLENAIREFRDALMQSAVLSGEGRDLEESE